MPEGAAAAAEEAAVVVPEAVAGADAAAAPGGAQALQPVHRKQAEEAEALQPQERIVPMDGWSTPHPMIS